jgi:hypothetical protein
VAEAIVRYPPPSEPFYPACAAYFEPLCAAAPRFSTMVDARVLFQVEGPGGGRWLADFREQTTADLSDDPRPREALCDSGVRLESRYMAALIDYRLRSLPEAVDGSPARVAGVVSLIQQGKRLWNQTPPACLRRG